MTIEQVQLTAEEWADFWKYFKNEPQQREAIEMLRQYINEADPTLLTQSTSWVEKFRSSPPAPEKLTPKASFDFKVTPSFSYGELTLYEPERRFTNQGQCDIAIEICEFLETARAKFGPLKITSGHRPPAVNSAVGGAANSEHLYRPGCGAVDVYPLNGEGAAFEQWVDKTWSYSVGYGMSYRGFTHCGIRTDRARYRWDY